MPYNESETLLFEDKIVPVISGGGFSFPIHVGDFKGGAEAIARMLILYVPTRSSPS